MSRHRLVAVGATLVAAALLPAVASATPPGRNGLIVWQREGPERPPHLWIANPDGTDARQVFAGTRHEAEFEGTFHPTDPNVMFFSRGAAPFKPFVETICRGDLTTGAVARLPVAGTADIAPTVSPDGTLLAWFAVHRAPLGEDDPPPPHSIRVADVDGSDMRILRPPDFPVDPDWSPDGTRLAFTQIRGEGDRVENRIATMNVDGTDVQALTPYGGPDELNPKWTPDGQSIVFERARRGGDRSAIASMPAAGGPARVVFDSPGWDTNPIPSPDGTQILFSSDMHRPRPDRLNRSFELYVMAADGSRPARITHNRGFDLFPGWQRLP